MNKKFSILHISDLHKGEDNDFECLYSSLCNDLDNYDKTIPKPEIIVVSGDLAEGAKGEKAEATIRQQYNEVESFLNNLVNKFLSGDKERIIIVPGNHDLYRKIAKDAMVIIPDELRNTARDQYKKGNLDYRWSWEEYAFYKVKDKDGYRKRFDLFKEFYNRFYSGVRQIDDCEFFNDVIDLPDYNVAFSTYNSCCNIDEFNQIGSISTIAINKAQADLSDMYRRGRLIFGVWHHNISGAPTVNYLDPQILRCLMDFHIQIGLYGHQHHCELIYRYHNPFTQGEMTLISSGCLYGRGKTMPPGTRCQYNIIEVDMTDAESARIKLHVREDETGWKIPSWRMKQIEGKDYYEMKIPMPSPDYNHIMSKMMEKAYGGDDKIGAVRGLLSIRETKPEANKIIDSILNLLSVEELSKIDFEPLTEVQLISLYSSAIETRNRMLIDKLESYSIMSQINNARIQILKEDASKIR